MNPCHIQRIVYCLVAALTCLFSRNAAASATPADTLTITAAHVKTAVLREGTHRYLVYIKMGKNANRTQTQFWTRTIARTTDNGLPVIAITQVWEDKDTIIHTTRSLCDAATLRPVHHESWWKQRGSGVFDFTRQTAAVNNITLSDTDTTRQRRQALQGFREACATYMLNWHLDLETFPILPYKKGITFLVPFYEPGYTGPAMVAYTVSGSGTLTGYNNQSIDCWLLTHESKGNKEVFWISKKTKEVLKLEQEINGAVYRYKIKLGFSM
jgi:hypothetical protein